MARYLSLFLKFASCLIVIGSASIASYSQLQQSRENADWEQRQRQRQREERETENRTRNLRNLGDRRAIRSSSPSASPRDVSPSKLTDEQKGLLKASPQDEAAFAGFLSQPDTGLIRLLPREKYDHTIEMPLKGGGAYYSFIKLSHQASPWSDIKFQDGQLHAGVNDLTLGLITVLGDVPLENLDSNHPAVKFIGQSVAPVNYADYQDQVVQHRSGFKAGGRLYRSVQQAQLNATYLLRSTIYHRADTVIALRLIRKDSDGGVTLLWKILDKLQVKKLKDVPREYRVL
jgi:hypothetical protein